MFGRDTPTLKLKTLCEQRPLRTPSIDQVVTSTTIPEKGTQEPYCESYFWWINPESTITIEDIVALYRYQYDKNFIYHTPSEKLNSIWYAL